MFAIFLALLIAVGGTLLSYFYDAASPLSTRCAMGICSGFALFATIAFALALLLGLNAVTISLALAIFLIPIYLTRASWQKNWRRELETSFSGALQQGETPRSRRATRLVLGALVLFVWWVFSRVFYEKPDGIYSAYVNNLGDLPLHLDIITNFAWGENFPPQNPIYSGNLFAYPFLTDFLGAIWVKCGADLRLALLIQNVALSFSIVILLHRFAWKLVRDRMAALMTPFLVIFCGGLGWTLFISDAADSESGFWPMLAHLPHQYTNADATWRWSNSLITLFITQRSLLLGFPLALTIFLLILRWISPENTSETNEIAPATDEIATSSTRCAARELWTAGFFASMLPLIHSHTFMTVALASFYAAFLLRSAWSEENWRGKIMWPSREWWRFFVAMAPLGALELAYLWLSRRTSPDSDATAFLGWHFGWYKGDANFFKFWLLNTGALWPLLLTAFWMQRESRGVLWRFAGFLAPLFALDLVPREIGIFEATWLRVLVLLYLMTIPFVVARLWPRKIEDESSNWWRNATLFWSILASVAFVLPNMLRFAPWTWDNNKILIYWFLFSAPFAALALAKMAKSSTRFRVAALLLFVSMTLAGALDIWRGVSAQSEVRIFDRDAILFAAALRDLPPRTVVLSAPTYNSPLCLAGRVAVMGYPGHLSSHGLKYSDREAEVRAFLRGDEGSERVLDLYGVGAFIIGPQERDYMASQNPPLQIAPDEHWKKWQKVAQNGEYSLFKTR